MTTRYQTYEMPYGWCTIDTDPSSTDSVPIGYISGPYDVTAAEADLIKHVARVEFNEDGTEVIVIPDGE